MGQYSGNANWDAESSSYMDEFLPDEYGIFTDPKTGKIYIGGQEVGRGLVYGGKHTGRRKGGIGAGRGRGRHEQYFEAGSPAEMAAFRNAMDNKERGKDLQTDRYKDNDIGGPGYQFNQAGGSGRRVLDSEGNTKYIETGMPGGIPAGPDAYNPWNDSRKPNTPEERAYRDAMKAWELNYRRGPEPEPPVSKPDPSEEFKGMQKRQYAWWNETTNGMRGSARKSLMDLQSAGLDAQKMANNYNGWGAGKLNRPRKSNIDHKQSSPSFTT